MKVKAAHLESITKRVRRREREDIVKWSRFGFGLGGTKEVPANLQVTFQLTKTVINFNP